MKQLLPILPILTFAACAAQTPQPPERQKEAAASNADIQAVVQGNNAFAFDLYERLRVQNQGNIVFSPYSISTALAMTYGGARGEMAERMARVLHFTLPPDQLHPAYAALASDLQKDDKARPYQLHVANALWPDKGLNMQPEFQQLLQQTYGAGLQQLDYFNATEESRVIIDRRVEEKTRNKIKDLLLPGNVNEATRLVLTNAIYFKAAWKDPFPKEATTEAPFEVAPSQKVPVPMMHHPEGMFNYFAGDGLQWLELPYKGDRLSMVVLLPQPKANLADLEATLTPASLQKGIAAMTMSEGAVRLPRFKMTLRLSLLGNLLQMGMHRGPLTAIGPKSELNIADVIHKAFIDVDEVGTEAAAATAVVIGADSARDTFVFEADHPFLFLIRDMQTGNILFLGRVTNPRI